MDKALRLKLVNILKLAKEFDTAYSAENRAWFSGKILDQLASSTPPTPDPDLEKKAAEIIKKANERVKADRDFTLQLKLDPPKDKLERKNIQARVEAIYGAIAQNKDFAETSFDAARRFIVKRRYRGITRMVHHINPNSNGFMRYPGECPSAGGMRLNKFARSSWTAARPTSAVPLKLQSGIGSDADFAAELIFTSAFPVACDGNLLDCGNGTGCVLMDTLFEAADAKKLFAKINSRDPQHLLVINPTFRLDPKQQQPNFLFEDDTQPEKLFSKQLVAEEDFQIGDHVYLFNHGLYPNLDPLGAWSGEHALVTQCGNRKPGDSKGFLYSGHGLGEPTTIEKLYDELIKILQTFIHRTYVIADLYFSFRSGKISIPAADQETKTFKLGPDPKAPSVVAHRLFNTVTYPDYRLPPSGGKPVMATEGTEHLPLIIFEIPEQKLIGIAPRLRDNTIEIQANFMSKMTVLKRTVDPPAGGNVFDKTLWQLTFVNTETFKADLFPLFSGKGGALKQLERSDMPKSKFGRRKPTDVGADTTRPTADTSTTYIQFLRNAGAIP